MKRALMRIGLKVKKGMKGKREAAGLERRYIFHLGTLQLSSLSLRPVNQSPLCRDLSGKEKLRLRQHIHLRPLFTEREGGEADGTKKTAISFEHRSLKGKKKLESGISQTYLIVA